MSVVDSMCRTELPEYGVIRVARWPEGLVLWVGGEIRWKSWETVTSRRAIVIPEASCLS